MSFQTRRIREERPRRAFPWRFIGSMLLAILGPLLGLLGTLAERREVAQEQTEQRQKRVHLLKRIAIVLLSILLALVLCAGVVRALVSLKILNLQSFLNVAGAELPEDANGYTNFLLLGRGDADHDGIDLTDTMMIASIDPLRTKSAVLLSIPRDLYVTSTEKMGKGRMNELYRDYKDYLRRTKGLSARDASREAMTELMQELGRKLGITLHHTVIVNFSGFVKAVDALGGIDMNVPYTIDDPEYPGPDYSYQTFHIDAGPQHLDGETALKYVRSRHTTSDFGRSARQQQVLQALSEKARSLGLATNPGKLLSLYGILSENVETTMTTSEILGAAKIAEGMDTSRIISMQMSDRIGLENGAYTEPGGFLYDAPRSEFGGAAVLLPQPLPGSTDSWKQLRSFTDLLLRMRSIYLSAPHLAVLNAGARTGLAGRLGAELTRYGFLTDRVENAAFPDKKQKMDTSGIVPATDQDKPTAAFFASLLHLPLLTTYPTELPLSQQSPITLLLGKDYNFQPIAQSLPDQP